MDKALSRIVNSAVKKALDAHRKFVVLEYAKAIGTVRKACRELGVPKSSFYEWKNVYEREGKAGLFKKNRLPKAIQGKRQHFTLHGGNSSN